MVQVMGLSPNPPKQTRPLGGSGFKRSLRLGTAGVIAVLALSACGPAASSIGGSTARPAATAYDVNGIHRVYVQPKLIQGHAWTLFVGGQFCPFCASMR